MTSVANRYRGGPQGEREAGPVKPAPAGRPGSRGGESVGRARILPARDISPPVSPAAGHAGSISVEATGPGEYLIRGVVGPLACPVGVPAPSSVLHQEVTTDGTWSFGAYCSHVKQVLKSDRSGRFALGAFLVPAGNQADQSPCTRPT